MATQTTSETTRYYFGDSLSGFIYGTLASKLWKEYKDLYEVIDIEHENDEECFSVKAEMERRGYVKHTDRIGFDTPTHSVIVASQPKEANQEIEEGGAFGGVSSDYYVIQVIKK